MKNHPQTNNENSNSLLFNELLETVEKYSDYVSSKYTPIEGKKIYIFSYNTRTDHVSITLHIDSNTGNHAFTINKGTEEGNKTYVYDEKYQNLHPNKPNIFGEIIQHIVKVGILHEDTADKLAFFGGRVNNLLKRKSFLKYVDPERLCHDIIMLPLETSLGETEGFSILGRNSVQIKLENGYTGYIKVSQDSGTDMKKIQINSDMGENSDVDKNLTILCGNGKIRINGKEVKLEDGIDAVQHFVSLFIETIYKELKEKDNVTQTRETEKRAITESIKYFQRQRG